MQKTARVRCGPLFTCTASILLAGAAWPVAAEPAFVLDLPGGGRLPGAFVAAPVGDEARRTLAWRSPLFVDPLEFRLDEIVGVRCPTPAAAPPEPRLGFSCHLRGGDVLDGELGGIDGRQVVLVPPAGGPLRIERAAVSAIVRRKEGGKTGFVGPGGLVGWTQSPASTWKDEAGRITCDVQGAGVSRDVGAPPRARYDVILSWRRKPELTLSVAAAGETGADPYRFEMLSTGAAGPVAMLVRQERGGGMLEPVDLPDVPQGRMHLTLFVDQAVGRLAAAVAGVNGVVDMKVPPTGQPGPATRFRLHLMSGDVCLERLRVSEWRAAEPVAGDAGATRIVLQDGQALEGEDVSLAAGGSLVVATAEGEQTRSLDDVTEIIFAGGEQQSEAASVRVVRQGGGVVSGDVLGVDEAGLVVRHPRVDRPVVVPLAELQSVVSLESAAPRPLPGRTGTIRLGDAELTGCLVDGGGRGLAWQPQGCVSGSPLAAADAGVSSVVEYVPRTDPAAAPAAGQVEVGGVGGVVNQDDQGFFIVAMLNEEGAAARDGRIQPGDRIVAIRPAKDAPYVETKGLTLATVMNLLRGRVGTPVGLRVDRGDGEPPRRIDLLRGLIYVADRQVLDEALATHARLAAGRVADEGEAAGFPSLLVLRSGDVVPAKIERVDADGVRLRSPATASGGGEEVVVPHRLVRAIELDPAAASRAIEKAQWERLLTLPRSQQADPPTHLVRLGTGDYLRGRLESLAGDGVRVNVLGQSKQLPVGSVVRVIWLHADEIEGLPAAAGAAEGGDPTGPPNAATGGLLVQGIAAGGGRATLVAERMDGPVIVGTSLAFGPSRIDTRKIDRLLLGAAVGAGNEELPFARWRLRPAPLPRALREAE